MISSRSFAVKELNISCQDGDVFDVIVGGLLFSDMARLSYINGCPPCDKIT